MITASIPVSRIARFRSALVDHPQLWWSLLYFFSLLCSYYVLRPVRDAMGASADATAVFPQAWLTWAQTRGVALGDFTLQLLFTGTFIAMVLLQPMYGALVSRFPRRVFLPAVYLVFVACLIGFYWMFDSRISGRGAAFFIWVAVFNLFAVSVFWSFMADVFDNHNARLVYGYIGAGGTIGALVGPGLTRFLVGPVGVANLLLVSAALLLVCLLCIVRLRPWALLRERQRQEADGEQAMGGSIMAGLRLIWERPVLRAIAALMFFGVGVGTLLYNEQAAIVREFYPGAEASTRYYSMIDWAINGVTIVIQLFVTRWLLHRHGIAPALLIPAVAIVFGYCLLAASPLPMLVAMVQILTRASEFSLSKPARETIYTQVDRESRYKAKAAIDTVIYRGGDLTFVWLHKGLAVFGSAVVFGGGILVALATAAGAWRVVQTQRRLEDPDEPDRAPVTL